jgi:dTMP kinase
METDVPRAGPPAAAGLARRVFGTPEFARLWAAQAVSSLGDWLGFLAILTLAGRLGASAPGASVGLVMAARIIPGFFLSAGAGVLVDRLDRRRVMVVTMFVRAAVVATLPFVDSVGGLVLASLVLEVATLFFSPAKEALVPDLVPADRLTQANSLGLAAAYGTFPLGAGLFALLAQVAAWLGTGQETVAFGVNVACYVASALLIATLGGARWRTPGGAAAAGGPPADAPADVVGAVPVPEPAPRPSGARQMAREAKEGWDYAFRDPVVRGVDVGLACGLIGGGMLVPLGQPFAEEVLGAGPSGYGVFVFALGMGVAAGVGGVSVLQRRLPKVRTFVVSCWATGLALLAGVSMSSLPLAAACVAVMGVFAGSVYVLGFTLLHEHVEDELRGRTFAALYTLVRLCVLLSMAIGPILSELLDELSRSLVDRRVDVGFEVAVPGVRLTLWLAGLIMLVAGCLAGMALRGRGDRLPAGVGAGARGPGRAEKGEGS